MKIEPVKKEQYRKHLNIVIVAFVTIFAITSILFGQLFIEFFAEPASLIETTVTTTENISTQETPKEESNFRFNLLGVIIALLLCAMLINTFKSHEFMKDVYYVWQLKQLHNQIFRKLKKIKLLASEKDENALITLSFYYLTLKQVYLLDDNTLTLSALERDTNNLSEKLGNISIEEYASRFQQNLLGSFK